MNDTKLQGSRKRSPIHPILALAIIFSVSVFSFGDLMEIVPLFAPVVASPIFHLFHEIHDLLAVAVALYAAYKYHARLGVAALLLFLAVHIPYAIIQFPKEAPELLRILVTGFVGLFGVWQINRLRSVEAKLRKSEEMFSKAFHVSPTGMTITRIADGKFIDANESFCRMFEFNRDEVIGHTSTELNMWTPEERRKIIQQQLQSGGLRNFELVARSKSGSLVNVLFSSVEMQIEGETCHLTSMIDVTERRRAQERIAHLNEVLKAVRNVNQLITREKNRESLIQKSCDLLVERGSYERSWILLLDENSKPVSVASAGFSRESSVFLEQLKTGNYVECVKELLSQEERFLAYDRPGIRHKDCVLADIHSTQGVFRCRLEHEGKLYGIIGTAVPTEAVSEKEEQSLFLELCGDIAFALANIEGEERRKQAEEQTRELKEYLQMQVDRMPIALIVWDTEFRVQAWNPSAERIFGFTAEEALGNHPYDIIVPKEAQPHVDTIWSRLLAGDMTAYSVNENITKDGRTIVCDWTNTPLKKDNSAVLGVLSMVQDITERKKAEIEIKREKAFSANIVATVPESLLVVDRDSRIKSTNRAFNELFQTEPEKVMGKKIADVLGDKDGKLSTQLARLFGTEDTLEDFELHYQSEKLGERILNIRARGMIVAEEEEEEEEEEELVVIQDITERKKIEEETRKLSEAVEATADIIFITDNQGVFQYVNPAFEAATGYKEEEVIGKTPRILKSGKQDYNYYKRLWETILAGGVIRAEVVNQKKNGELFHVEQTVTPIKNSAGNITHFVSTNKDITERKKMQEQLMSQDRLASIGQLVAGVAHEINNPLTGVIGFSDLLLQRKLPKDIRDDLQIISDEAKRTALIVKNLLTFARKQPEGKAPVDINEQIQKALDLRDHEQKVNNIQVITRFASDLPQVMGNTSQLQQVFFNIVINAEFFMLEAHQKGNLAITTERTGDFVRASFTDDGPGISDKSMKSLFTPFFTTKEVGKGTGLGLSICHGIINEHGGRIYAESEVGKGATFIVELPIQEEATS